MPESDTLNDCAWTQRYVTTSEYSLFVCHQCFINGNRSPFGDLESVIIAQEFQIRFLTDSCNNTIRFNDKLRVRNRFWPSSATIIRFPHFHFNAFQPLNLSIFG